MSVTNFRVTQPVHPVDVRISTRSGEKKSSPGASVNMCADESDRPGRTIAPSALGVTNLHVTQPLRPDPARISIRLFAAGTVAGCGAAAAGNCRGCGRRPTSIGFY